MFAWWASTVSCDQGTIWYISISNRSIFNCSNAFQFLAARLVQLKTSNWWLLRRLDSILIRLHEHGLIVYFERLSQRTFKPTIGPVCTTFEAMTAQPGGFQEIQIACGIYVFGIFSGIFTFLLEICCSKTKNVSLRRLFRQLKWISISEFWQFTFIYTLKSCLERSQRNQ